jgi:hypothetical protein
MPVNPLVELVAEAIYRNSGGLTDSEYLDAMGEARREWKTDKPWDSDPENELCEHERDEYRLMAKAAIKAVIGED